MHLMALVAPEPVLAAAIITNGLLAGLFFAFSCAISPGFRSIDDRSYVRAFRAINAAILNVWFLSIFLAAPLSATASVVLHAWHGGSVPSILLLSGAICSILTFGITLTASVPLNRGLEQSRIDSEQQRGAARGRFEARWNRWNLVRALTSIGALTSLTFSVIW